MFAVKTMSLCMFLSGGKLQIIQHIYTLHKIWQLNFTVETQTNLCASCFNAALTQINRSTLIIEIALVCKGLGCQCLRGTQIQGWVSNLNSLLVPTKMSPLYRFVVSSTSIHFDQIVLDLNPHFANFRLHFTEAKLEYDFLCLCQF